MTTLEFVALILAGVGPLLALARMLRLPDTLVLFGAGLGAASAPGLPPVQVDPQLMLVLFLPPILYAATVRTSYHLLRHTLVSGVLLGVVLSLATVAAVAWAARLLLPELSWVAAFLIGSAVAVFDTRLFHEAKGRPHVPRAVADALKTREIVGRIVVLCCFGLALDALRGQPPVLAPTLGEVAVEIGGGALVGAALGRVMVWARERIEPAPVEIAVSIATPYLAALAAQALDLSVAALIIAAALVISAVRIDPETGAPRTSAESRVSAMAFWEEVSLLLSAILFFLAGWTLPGAVADLTTWSAWRLSGAAAALLAVALAVQFLASLLAAVLPAPADELDADDRRPAHRIVIAGVMSWASTRSVIGLVLALSVPASLPDGQPFGERYLILVVAALAVVGSILVQGLSLRAVVRAAGLTGGHEAEREKRTAERAMAEASPDGDDFAAVRRALLDLRARNRVGDETLREMLREVDLRQRTTEESALPGAGPPNP